jgi:hypothetical protein
MAYLVQNQIRILSASPVMTHILDVKLTFITGSASLNIFSFIVHMVFNNEV